MRKRQLLEKPMSNIANVARLMQEAKQIVAIASGQPILIEASVETTFLRIANLANFLIIEYNILCALMSKQFLEITYKIYAYL